MMTIKDNIRNRANRFQNVFLKVEMLSKLQMFLSSLFHSDIAYWKK